MDLCLYYKDFFFFFLNSSRKHISSASSHYLSLGQACNLGMLRGKPCGLASVGSEAVRGLPWVPPAHQHVSVSPTHAAAPQWPRWQKIIVPKHNACNAISVPVLGSKAGSQPHPYSTAWNGVLDVMMAKQGRSSYNLVSPLTRSTKALTAEGNYQFFISFCKNTVLLLFHLQETSCSVLLPLLFNLSLGFSSWLCLPQATAFWWLHFSDGWNEPRLCRLLGALRDVWINDRLQ